MESDGNVINLIHTDQAKIFITRDFLDSFQHLEKVIDDVFSTITKRINHNASKLNELNHRAAVANAKVLKLRGSKKATQVFSSSRYPGRSECLPSKRLFYEQPIINIQTTPVQTLNNKQYDSNLLNERQDFFHVRQYLKKYSRNNLPRNGLGQIPPTISSISSLFLYNTSHNPYRSNRIVDPFETIPATPRSKKQQRTAIFEPPMSIKDGDDIGVPIINKEFQFLPDLDDLPELDLPMELPSLSGIADNLLFSGDVGPGIAPSIILPDLPPEIINLPNESGPEPPPPMPPPADNVQITNEFISNDQIIVGHSSKILENDPKPPISHTSKVLVDVAIPPPPPPPTPPPILSRKVNELSDGSNNKEKSKSQQMPSEVPGDSRSELMKAIQMAGGASKAGLRKRSSTSEVKRMESAPPSGDLMSDLATKLSQRRKGISGNQSKKSDSNNTTNPPMNTMQIMSSIIPPPPMKDEVDLNSSSTNHSEDDWDD